MNEEKNQMNQYAMIWNYNAHVEHQHNYFGGKKDEMENDECCELVDLKFFSMKHFGSMESQKKLRQALKGVMPKMNADSGRDWVAAYIAYHFFTKELKLKKRFVDFFSDIEGLLPNVLKKVKKDESGDKRYKTYTEALSKECDKWFIYNECLPPMNEWTSMKYRYYVDNERRTSIQQLVTEIHQGMNS